jgi:hypothetical protein
MARRALAPGSKRPHSDTPRRHRIAVSLNDREFDAVRSMAAARGMTPGACLARLGTDAAYGRLLSASQADAVDRMGEAAVAANRIGGLLNQAVRRLHSTGLHSPDVDAAARMAAAAVARVQEAVLKAARELRR